jgi:hypothetical protein
MQPKGRRTGNGRVRFNDGSKIERAAKERYISTYCRLVHSAALRLYLQPGGAREGPGPTGKPREERARRAREQAQEEFQGARERSGRKGPRGQTDRREIQRMRRCTPTRLLTMKKKEGE